MEESKKPTFPFVPMRPSESLFERAMKRVFPTASAAPAQAQPEEPQEDPWVLNRRRNMIGRAYSMCIMPSENTLKYEDLTSESRDLFSKQTFDGFHFDLQKQLGQRFMTMHQIALGQRSQEEPPSNYSFMTHFVMPSGGVVIGRLTKTGDMMARYIYESKFWASNFSYNVQRNIKGEEASSVEAEVLLPGPGSTWTGKYMYQQTPQGGGGAFELTYSKSIGPHVITGLSALILPDQGRIIPSFTARYEACPLNESEEAGWEGQCDKARNIVEKLTDQDPLTEYDAVILSAAFFKPKYVWGLSISPQTPSLELSYFRSISPSLKLGTQYSLAPHPPPQQKPNLLAKWQVGYEYSVDPGINVKASITNLTSLSCVYEDRISELIGYNVSTSINYPKDSYKMGFGVSFNL